MKAFLKKPIISCLGGTLFCWGLLWWMYVPQGTFKKPFDVVWPPEIEQQMIDEQSQCLVFRGGEHVMFAIIVRNFQPLKSHIPWLYEFERDSPTRTKIGLAPLKDVVGFSGYLTVPSENIAPIRVRYRSDQDPVLLLNETEVDLSKGRIIMFTPRNKVLDPPEREPMRFEVQQVKISGQKTSIKELLSQPAVRVFLEENE